MANNSTSSSTARGFRGDIQGLRAIAVLAVVLYHAGVPWLPGGYVGVDVFFVISGFLITTHLLGGLQETGRIDFARFYARRARRILPASFMVLALSVLAALIWYPPLLMEEVWRGAVSTALYVPNYFFAITGTDYLAESTPSLFQHYWSLGIEEQFYLVWPVLLMLIWSLSRSRRALLVICGATVIVSFAACVFLTFHNQPWAFFSLPTRGWELGVGGIVAFVLVRRPQIMSSSMAASLGWLGIAGILISILLFTSETAFPGYWAMVPVASTAAVILAGSRRSRFGPDWVLSLGGMKFLGLISYSLYLVHWPALRIPQAVVGFQNPMPLWLTTLIVGLCVPVAWLMYRYVENPTRNLEWLIRARPSRSLWAAGIASIACVALVSGAYAFTGTRDLHTNDAVAHSAVTSPPVFTQFVPQNLTPELRAASDDQPIIYEDGCHRNFSSVDSSGCVYGVPGAPRIAIFGDSHAAQWFPAIEKFAVENGYAVESFTKSSCPSVDIEIIRNGVPYQECDEWRAGVIDRLNQRPPALVLLSNFGSVGKGSDHAARWGEGLEMTIESLAMPVAVIADSPNLGVTPSVCLSANLTAAEACGIDRDNGLRGLTRNAEQAVAAEYSVPFIDLNNYICNSLRCSPIVGNTLVYRDANHLTATYSALLADPLSIALSKVLIQP